MSRNEAKMSSRIRAGVRLQGSRPKKPRRLRAGAVIGIAAPASPFDRESFERGMHVLHSLGFETVVPEGLWAARGYLAGRDEHRAAILQRLFADARIDGVICARGGYGSLRILPLLDYGRLAACPKVFIGFSDATALLSAITERCGWVTFHGPLVTSLANASPGTLASFQAAVGSETPLIFQPQAAVCLRPGTAAGVVCGGNLTTLCHLLGTPFQPSFRNRILFLEDRGEAPYRIDRMLTQLKLAGCFKGLCGLVLGSFTDCGPTSEILEIVDDLFAGAGIPILAGMEAGHAEPNLTLPLGAAALLDAGQGSLRFESATLD
jgi:muramoyltetrapeptide carboxypeptidase